MKKQFIYISTALVMGWVIFSSCNNSGAAETKLQHPVLTEGSDGNGNATINEDNADTKTKVTDDLLAAFKGETTASAKYSAYAKKAEQEGFHNIAILFKAASAAEKIHASNHLSVLTESGIKAPSVTPEFTVQSTKENLEDAIKGESYEAATMYPGFIKDAETAGDQSALMSLNYALKTEKKHKIMYENALTSLGKNTVTSLPTVYYVCPVCGNTYDSAPASRCSICMTSSEKFITINSL
jgi:rubrerythrin